MVNTPERWIVMTDPFVGLLTPFDAVWGKGSRCYLRGGFPYPEPFAVLLLSSASEFSSRSEAEEIAFMICLRISSLLGHLHVVTYEEASNQLLLDIAAEVMADPKDLGGTGMIQLAS